MATAPSWRGPYSAETPFGGSITTEDYPYDENEDPFLWKSSRGFHALFHANTWLDSRGATFPVPMYAGRYAFSIDGRNWTYAREPPFNGTVVWSNGTVSPFARIERPYLIFDSDGTPAALVNGAQRYAWNAQTFTLVRPVQK